MKMTKEELEKTTEQELIEQRDYCGVDGYYGDYLDNVNAEMLKRFNRIAELEAQIEKMRNCANCKNYNGNEGFCVLGSGYGYNCNLEKMGDKRKMTRQQEFRKQTEEAKFEAFSLMCKKVAELEKENAELKSIADFQQSGNMSRYFELKRQGEQLTKAKEIIREFMKYEINEYDGSLEIHFEELKKQAEQFLSEVEK